jgi:tetratricopeptide (TPR) repeat protein
VAGRLAEALQREVNDARLKNIRITIWPQVVEERHPALQAGQEISATLVIYGEYDVGRVVVKFAHPANRDDFTDPVLQRHVLNMQELSATINSDLPQQVRSLALMALGQIFLSRAEADQACPLLAQARDNLKTDTTVDPQTLALVNFFLGTAYHHSDPPALDAAIVAYTEAVEIWPQMLSSRLNRSAAYAARKNPQDLQLALADAEALIAAEPDWAPAYNNRASIRVALGGAENLALAVHDLDRALTLEPALPEAYFNRAYVSYAQQRTVAAMAPDLEQALALRPDYGAALNLFCWGLAIEQQSKQALPYCQQAVTVDPRPVFLDSRGLVYALLGDYPAAVADFQTYADWLEEQPGKSQQTQLARRKAWINALQADENPFTPQLLAELRREFGQ